MSGYAARSGSVVHSPRGQPFVSRLTTYTSPVAAIPGRQSWWILDSLESDGMSDSVAILVALAIALLLAYGLSWWTFRAKSDRSAKVGLYLVLGAPGFLIAIYGLATLVRGNENGAIWLLSGLGLTLPLLPPFRNFSPDSLPWTRRRRSIWLDCRSSSGVMGFLGGGYAVDPEPVETGSSVSAARSLESVHRVHCACVHPGRYRHLADFPRSDRSAGRAEADGKQLGIAVGFVVLGFAVMIYGGRSRTLSSRFQRRDQSSNAGDHRIGDKPGRGCSFRSWSRGQRRTPHPGGVATSVRYSDLCGSVCPPAQPVWGEFRSAGCARDGVRPWVRTQAIRYGSGYPDACTFQHGCGSAWQLRASRSDSLEQGRRGGERAGNGTG